MKFITVMVHTHSLSLALIHRGSHIFSELHVNVLQGFVVLAEKHDVVFLVFQESTENSSYRKHFSSTFSVHIYSKPSNQRMC